MNCVMFVSRMRMPTPPEPEGDCQRATIRTIRFARHSVKPQEPERCSVGTRDNHWQPAAGRIASCGRIHLPVRGARLRKTHPEKWFRSRWIRRKSSIGRWHASTCLNDLPRVFWTPFRPTVATPEACPPNPCRRRAGTQCSPACGTFNPTATTLPAASMRRTVSWMAPTLTRSPTTAPRPRRLSIRVCKSRSASSPGSSKP